MVAVDIGQFKDFWTAEGMLLINSPPNSPESMFGILALLLKLSLFYCIHVCIEYLSKPVSDAYQLVRHIFLTVKCSVAHSIWFSASLFR